MTSYEINLLPKKKNKVADRLLYFILYYFRYIIVITQIVVIGVFFFRFQVDQSVIDLKEAFKQKQQILAVTIPIVEEAKLVEAKTTQVKKIIDDQELFLARLNFILDSIPQNTTLNTLDLLEREIFIRGASTDVFSIRSLHQRMVVREGFELAEITSIERQTDNTFDFVIRVPLEEKND